MKVRDWSWAAPSDAVIEGAKDLSAIWHPPNHTGARTRPTISTKTTIVEIPLSFLIYTEREGACTG